MSGFVGTRAKKKNRNLFLILIIIIILAIFFVFLPTSDFGNNEIIPNDNITPNQIEDLTSLSSNIEQLELVLFQKDQKIKFRDGQIKNLQNKIKNNKLLYEKVVIELNDIKNNYNLLFSEKEKLISTDKYNLLEEKFTKLNIEYNKNTSTIKNLNKTVDEEINFLKSKNKKLNKDIKNIFAKNIKSQNMIVDLKKIIKEQQIEINLELKEIKKLKDRSLHGG